MNLADIIIGIIVIAVITVSLIVTVRKRKNGGCGCGCDGCSKKCSKEKNIGIDKKSDI